jgi:hypothetical protein
LAVSFTRTFGYTDVHYIIVHAKSFIMSRPSSRNTSILDKNSVKEYSLEAEFYRAPPAGLKPPDDLWFAWGAKTEAYEHVNPN